MKKFLHADSSLIVYIFVSRLTGLPYINIICRKMTALIDMPKLVKKSTDQNYRSINKDQIMEASIILAEAF